MKIDENSNHLNQTIKDLNMYDVAQTMIIAYEKKSVFIKHQVPKLF